MGSSYRKKPPFRESIKYQPAIVIIKLGTNDSKPKNWIHKDHYIEDYISLINTYKKLSSSPQIWICYSVPAYPGRWGISDEVIRTELQPMLDEIAAQTDTKIIDLYSALSNKKELFPDKVHLNTKGAKILAETVATVLKKLVSSQTYPLLPCDPRKIIGIEQKSGKEDQGIAYFEDMSFGISSREILQQLRELKVNNIRIPIMNKMRVYDRGDIVVSFVKKIHDAGGRDLGIILSVRRHKLISPKQQDRWCEDLAYIYNKLKDAQLHHMVVGCSFDENAILNDKQSNKAMWDDRHKGVLAAMAKLNGMTGGDFKKRTVFIHGKGLGAQFSGVKASSDSLSFPEEMKKHSANYCYNFKFYQTGFPQDKSKEGWVKFLYSYCGLDEVALLGVPIIFVGDSGDGIRAGGFAPGSKVYGKCGPEVMHALVKVFAENSWSGFSFGVFVEESKGRGRTALYTIINNKIKALVKPLKCWSYWKEIVLE